MKELNRQVEDTSKNIEGIPIYLEGKFDNLENIPKIINDFGIKELVRQYYSTAKHISQITENDYILGDLEHLSFTLGLFYNQLLSQIDNTPKNFEIIYEQSEKQVKEGVKNIPKTLSVIISSSYKKEITSKFLEHVIKGDLNYLLKTIYNFEYYIHTNERGMDIFFNYLKNQINDSKESLYPGLEKFCSYFCFCD